MWIVKLFTNIALLFTKNATSKNEKHFVIWSIIYSWMDKENEVCTHIIELYMYLSKRISISLKNEGNSAICNNMGESRGHYAKWNKSDKYSMFPLKWGECEKHFPSPYKKLKATQIRIVVTKGWDMKEKETWKSRMIVARGWGEGFLGRVFV